MKIVEIFTYSNESLTTFELYESDGGWTVQQTSAFKSGFKKHSKNPRVMKEFKKLLEFIKDHNQTPSIRSYPPELNVHQIKKDKRFENTLWGHLVGQLIGILFSVDAETKTIKLIHIGTHQEIGWS